MKDKRQPKTARDKRREHHLERRATKREIRREVETMTMEER